MSHPIADYLRDQASDLDDGLPEALIALRVLRLGALLQEQAVAAHRKRIALELERCGLPPGRVHGRPPLTLVRPSVGVGRST